MKYHILIVGAGQLGSRHLQALALSDLPLKVSVVDPSSESLRVAQDRYNQVLQDSSSREVEYFHSIESVEDKDIDVCVMATSARYRLAILESMLDALNIKNLVLEKVLFQSEQQMDVAAGLIRGKGINTWVNCPRRMMDIYSLLKARCAGETIELKVSGVNWGLACNAIHWIDIWAFLTNAKTYALDVSQLSENLVSSKREGYMELYGAIRGDENGHGFTLACSEGVGVSMTAEIHCNGETIKIDESLGEVNVYQGDSHVERIEFSLPFQSQLTQIVVNDVVTNGSSQLTAYSESASLHQPLLREFLKHFNSYGDSVYSECPIT